MRFLVLWYKGSSNGIVALYFRVTAWFIFILDSRSLFADIDTQCQKAFDTIIHLARIYEIWQGIDNLVKRKEALLMAFLGQSNNEFLNFLLSAVV